jgi:hypothetical protein
MGAAEPIAHAMTLLHGIESSQGAALHDAAPAALDALRRALGMLQTTAVAHPACEQGMEAVATALGEVHTLVQLGQSAAPAAGNLNQPGAAFAGTMVAGGAPSAAAASSAGYPQQAAGQQYAAQPPAQQYAAQPPAQQYAAQAPQVAAAQDHYASAGAPMADPFAAPAAAPQVIVPNDVPEAPRPGGKQRVRVEAELGAHSTTNFYKGLSGNDLIDSGGIFVATYQIPPVGSELVLKVSMPGGYEFEALGIVQWTRDAPNSGADSSPGFGAKFTQISPEGRQLVYRYVRNREPLFHDDL